MTVGAFAVLAAVGRGDAESRARLHAARVGRPGLAAAGARPGHGVLPVLAGRDPADRRLPRQVRDLPGRGRSPSSTCWPSSACSTPRWPPTTTCACWSTMYMREPETEELPLPVSPGMASVMVLAVVGVLYLGLAPGRVLELVQGLATALI